MKKTVLALSFLLLSAECYAGDPFDWAPAPQGTYLSVHPLYYSASKLTDRDGEAATNDLGLSSYQAIARVIYYNKTTFPNTWGFTAYAPVGKTNLLGESDSGIGDITIGAGYWFLEDTKTMTSLIAGSFIDIPIGDYDKDRLVNIGTNVYKFRPFIAGTASFRGFYTEAALKYNIYTEEVDTGIRAGDEIIGDGYAGYFLRPNLLVGGVFNAMAGRNLTIDGADVSGTGVRKYQAGPSVCWIGNGLSVTFDALKEFGTRNTSEGYILAGRISWKL